MKLGYDPVISDGLVAWYPLNMDTKDYSGNNNHGVVNGAANVQGFNGGAYKFVRNNSNYISTTNTIPSTGDFTVSFWGYTTISDSNQGLLSSRTVLGQGFSIILISRTIRVDSGSHQWSTPYSMPLNEWVFITVTRVSSTKSIYINGQFAYSSTGVPSTLNVGATLGIGSTNVNGSSLDNFLDGFIQDVRVYNRALSQEEITTLYNLKGKTFNLGNFKIDKAHNIIGTKNSEGKLEGTNLRVMKGYDPVVSDGLLAWYPLNESANDYSGNGNHGVVSGATLAEGLNGGAYSFNGSSSSIAIPNSSVDSPKNITVNAWIKTISTLQTSIVRRWTHGYSLYLSKHIEFTVYVQSGSEKKVTSPAEYNDGLWHFVSGTYDGSNVALYVDGVLVASTPASGDIYYSNTQYWVGRDGGGGSKWFNGLIQDVRIYNRALTLTEISTLYSLQGRTYFYSKGLLAHYQFNGNLLDSSGKGFNIVSGSGTYTQGKHGTGGISLTGTLETNLSFISHLNYQTEDYSFGGWFKFNESSVKSKITSALAGSPSDSQQATGNLLGHSYYGGSSLVWYSTDANSIDVYFSVRGSSERSTPTSPMVFGRWVHYLCVVDNKKNEFRFYEDGILIGSRQTTYGTLPADRKFYINLSSIYAGNGPSSTLPFEVSDVRIYNYAISEDRVKIFKELNVGNGYKPVVGDGLVAWYPLNENANDYSGNGKDGTPVGVTLTKGLNGGAYSFDGVSGHIRVDNYQKVSTRFSISMWAKKNSSWTDNYYVLASTTENGGFNFERLSNNPTIGFYMYIGGGYKEVVKTMTDVSLDWHLFTGTWDGNLVSFYFDGVLVGTVGGSGIFHQPMNRLFIGAENNNDSLSPSYFFDGLIQDVRIYDRALTPIEINTIYSLRGQTKFTDSLPSGVRFYKDRIIPDGEFIDTLALQRGLVAWYPLDKDANDYSGNGNNGTVSGATLVSGLNGGAYSFDGVDDRITVPNSSYINFGDEDFAVGGWFYNRVQNTNRGLLTKTTSYSDAALNWGLDQGENNGWRFRINSGDNNVVTTLKEYSIKKWVHIVGIYKKGGIAEIYINGKLESTKSGVAYPVPNNGNLYIGSYYTGNFFNGIIQDVRIYNRALSSQEVRMLYALKGRRNTLKFVNHI